MESEAFAFISLVSTICEKETISFFGKPFVYRYMSVAFTQYPRFWDKCPLRNVETQFAHCDIIISFYIITMKINMNFPLQSCSLWNFSLFKSVVLNRGRGGAWRNVQGCSIPYML